jgi:two-component system, OmpR family, phosphate regulon sensor histidine kinase PhoR
MSVENLQQLARLIQQDKEPLLDAWQRQVCKLPSARDLDEPTLRDHVPTLLDELVECLRRESRQTIAETLTGGSPPLHGLERFENGFDIVEVVAEYNILRGCIHAHAEAHDLHLNGRSFHILNRVLDEAIGLAVQTFATQQSLEVQRRRDEYLAFITHDLRTPLSAISMATRILEMNSPETETGPLLGTLRRNLKHLETLVDRVLKESAHIQSDTSPRLERRQIDLWPLVEALIHDLQPVAGTSTTRLVNTVPQDLTAFADAGLIRRVFQNLIANAITFTPRGEVTISARDAPQGGVECSVQDNGSGIQAELLDRVFDQRTTSRDEGGTGLGLAIAKSFVEAHGGTISVASTPGQGALFRFSLPPAPRSG